MVIYEELLHHTCLQQNLLAYNMKFYIFFVKIVISCGICYKVTDVSHSMEVSNNTECFDQLFIFAII